ncbi:Archaeal/vacuolar-type H+-ATPase subunit E [Halanaeroarchaeum sp. HSR-CO]|uniref:V-type ATP synthase subunit E n=1 Tax=Halanaeroarchaeum sp. HSR-CO TaxID=2866382 RepID=UPI00217CFB27|nr:V-type ATP synthase subunit E [Halanaeroarchaeum sp. HSR-CO]UWG46639.1 Archaeal/vacuolar-type H+-ATPase subunit E [Halanaeroarchaeum sp. HSR-CO]
MSLDTVVEDIREEARARVEEIEADAEERAEAIVADAEAEAAEIREAAEREVEREIERKRDQRIASANLEAKQERLEARREVLSSVREELENRIETLPDEDREQLVRVLLDAADEEFDEDATLEVYTRAADTDLLETVLEDYDRFELAGDIDCLGGVVVESDQSRVRVNNTFDSLLEDVWEDNLKAVSARIFEEK